LWHYAIQARRDGVGEQASGHQHVDSGGTFDGDGEVTTANWAILQSTPPADQPAGKLVLKSRR